MTTEPCSEHNDIIAWSHNARIPATIRRRVTYHTLAAAGWVVVAKEVTMNETLRASLYGILIPTAALLPPVISLIELIAKFCSS
jgi:hypothetical protein